MFCDLPLVLWLRSCPKQLLLNLKESRCVNDVELYKGEGEMMVARLTFQLDNNSK